MHKMASVVPLMLSVLIVCTSLSVSACDLSCWMNHTSSDCHSATSASEDRMTASSAMQMSAGMEMPGSTPREVSNSEVSASPALDHSRALSPCSHETCSQAAASSSPQNTSQARSPGLHRGVIRVSTPPNLLTSSNRLAPRVPPLINHSVNVLSPLRI